MRLSSMLARAGASFVPTWTGSKRWSGDFTGGRRPSRASGCDHRNRRAASSSGVRFMMRWPRSQLGPRGRATSKSSMSGAVASTIAFGDTVDALRRGCRARGHDRRQAVRNIRAERPKSCTPAPGEGDLDRKPWRASLLKVAEPRSAEERSGLPRSRPPPASRAETPCRVRGTIQQLSGGTCGSPGMRR